MTRLQGRMLAGLGLLMLAGAALGAYLALRGEAPGKMAAIVGRAPTVLGWPVAIGDALGSAGARFSDPFGLALARDGTLYVADAGDSNRIVRLGVDGVASVLAGGREGFADGPGAQAAFHTPSGLALDKAGNLYVADTGNHRIRKVTPEGVVTTLAGNGEAGFADGPGAQARFNGPLAVAVDKAGRVFVADTYNDRIRVIAPDGAVSTLAGGAPGQLDGPALDARFDTPSGLALDARGNLYVADTANGMVRKVGVDGQVTTIASGAAALLRRPVALALTHDDVLYVGDMGRGRLVQISAAGEVRGLTGPGIDIEVGDESTPRFARPTAIVLRRDGSLYVADALRQAVRAVVRRGAHLPAPASAQPARPVPASFPWPFAPQDRRHEVVGILGEVRGSYDGESRHHFHGGLDVQANMGEPVLAVQREKVSSPLPNWAFGDLGEGMVVADMAYIHMRVGRTLKDEPLDETRFTILRDEKDKPARVRVRRGTRFEAGDKLGTVNRMFHVHLSYQPGGQEANALALPFAEFADSIAPRISGIALVGADEKRLLARQGKRLLVARDAGPLAIVVDAYDQADGNAARRRLGLYRAGYQILQADGTPLAGFETPLMNIEFNRLPPDPESVKVAYAPESGITVYGNKSTRFLYVVTNRVRDGVARVGAWDPAALAPGDYLVRIHAADFAGNLALGGRDLAITVR